MLLHGWDQRGTSSERAFERRNVEPYVERKQTLDASRWYGQGTEDDGMYDG
jgi:hypothetical protein